jgi:predicted DNA binding protein
MILDNKTVHLDTIAHPITAFRRRSSRTAPTLSRVDPEAAIGPPWQWGHICGGADERRRLRIRANADTPVRSELIVPIGDFGVFLVGSTSTAAFGETDVEYLELLATNTEAALEQVGYKQRLERQNERLRELARLNSTIRSINQSVLEASTKEEIAAEVCETIIENDPYLAAWIGEYRTDQEVCIYASRRRSLSLHGMDERLLASARETIQTDHTSVTEVPTAGESDRLRIATVPLTAGETTHGVLALYTDQPDLFDEEEIEILRELGQTVGRAMRAAETRKTLTSETATQLDFEVSGTDWFFRTLSEDLDCRLELEGVVPVEDDRLLYYATVEGVPAAEVVAAAEASTVIEAARAISPTDGGVVEFTVAGETLIAGLTSRGASVQTAVADRGEGHIVAEVASETDVRTLVRALEDVCPGLELRSRQELDRPVTSDQQFRESLGDRLTDRQVDVLRAAFRAGYFEWPRDSTAEDIAASFDVASSTVHFHLRNALQSMLATFFEEADPDGEAG